MAKQEKLPIIKLSDLDVAMETALELTIVNQIVRKTPSRTGLTRNAWFFGKVKPLEYSLSNDLRGSIILFTEGGTRSHIIRPKLKKALAWGKTLGRTADGKPIKEYITKKVKHPGFEGLHYISSTLTDKDIEKQLKKILEEQLKRLSKG